MFSIFVVLGVLLVMPNLIQCACPNIISRSSWGANPPTSPLVKLSVYPPPNVIIYSTITPNCFSKEECKKRVKSIQTYHQQNKGWADIAYNFLVGGDGNIYEGRGWGFQGAHSPVYNKNSIAIGIIGNDETQPSKGQLKAVDNLVECGVKNGEIKRGYHLINTY